MLEAGSARGHRSAAMSAFEMPQKENKVAEQAQRLRGSQAPDPPQASPVRGSRQAGSSRQQSSASDFEMLISRLPPFMPPSLGPTADRVRGETAEPEREEMEGTAGAPSFSPGQGPCRAVSRTFF